MQTKTNKQQTLSGKGIVITGSTTEIGRATALLVAQQRKKEAKRRNAQG